MNFSYSLSCIAEQDLIEIWNYISADSPTAANDLLDRLFDKFELLTQHPLMGVRREELLTNMQLSCRELSGLLSILERPDLHRQNPSWRQRLGCIILTSEFGRIVRALAVNQERGPPFHDGLALAPH